VRSSPAPVLALAKQSPIGGRRRRDRIIVYRSHSATAKKTVANIEATGGEAIAFRADMAKERISNRYSRRFSKNRPLDILVNSAGMENKCPFLTMR